MSEPPRTTGWEGADKWFAPSARTNPPAEGEPEGPPPPPRCAVCNAELDPDQTYCLECGSPTPLAPRLRRPKTAYILAGAMVVLGLGAGILAYAVANDDDTASSSGGTPTAPLTLSTDTMPVVPLPPETGPTTGTLPPDTTFTAPIDTTDTTDTTGGTGTGFDTVTGPSPTVPVETTTGGDTSTSNVPSEPATTAAPTGSSDWPAGTTAWTAILSSLGTESAAQAAKTKLEGEGEQAGVLFSSDFPDLRPGYYVVFSGTYDSQSAAVAQATKLRGQFPGAYARRITG